MMSPAKFKKDRVAPIIRNNFLILKQQDPKHDLLSKADSFDFGKKLPFW